MLLGATAAAAATVAPQNPPPFASSSCCSSFCQRERRRQRSTSQSQLPPIASVLNLRGSAAPPPLRFLSPWTGAVSPKQLRLPSLRLIEKRGRFRRRKAPYASLFGVGAPEALVIGVVALLVFGPKGLAEVARNLGKTLRAFQPTIRELQDVSREFKSTLEREIGLDEVSSPANNSYKANSFSNLNQQVMTDPNGTPKSGAYTSEDLLKVTQEQLAATSTESEEVKTIPGVQQDLSVSKAVSDGPSKVAASATPEAADQIQSSEKPDRER